MYQSGGERGGIGGMAVEQDAQADLAGVGDHLVHDLDGREAAEFGIAVEVDGGGLRARIEHLGGEGQTDGIEAEALHLVHHVLVVTGPEAVRGEIGLEAEPVDAGDADGVAGGIENLVAAGMPVAFAGGEERGRGGQQQDKAGGAGAWVRHRSPQSESPGGAMGVPLTGTRNSVRGCVSRKILRENRAERGDAMAELPDLVSCQRHWLALQCRPCFRLPVRVRNTPREPQPES